MTTFTDRGSDLPIATGTISLTCIATLPPGRTARSVCSSADRPSPFTEVIFSTVPAVRGAEVELVVRLERLVTAFVLGQDGPSAVK